MAKLFEKTELLDTVKHKNLSWYCLKGECPLQCCLLPKRSSIVLSEVPILYKHFPISFVVIKGEGDKLMKDINVFYKLEKDKGHCTFLEPNTGCTLGEEKPLSCKQYPFSIVLDHTNRKLVQLDFTCPGFNTEGKGEPIFLNGNLHKYFNKEFLQPAKRFFDDRKATQEFVESMFNNNLVVSVQFIYKNIQIPLNIIDENRLVELPKEILKEFVIRGYLKIIYYHLHSIQNWTKLIDKYLQDPANSPEIESSLTEETKSSITEGGSPFVLE